MFFAHSIETKIFGANFRKVMIKGVHLQRNYFTCDSACAAIIFKRLRWHLRRKYFSNVERNRASASQIAYEQGRTQGRGLGAQPPPPIGLSTKMHNKENVTFLALLSLFFCNDADSNMI